MADLTQNIKYIVTVDTTALDNLRQAIEAASKASKIAVQTARTDAASTKALQSGTAEHTKATNRELEREALRLSKLTYKAHRTALTILEEKKQALAKAAKAEVQYYNQGMRNMAAFEAFAKKKAAERAAEAASQSPREMMSNFLKLYGTVFAAKSVITQSFQAIKEGAQSLDLNRVLGTQLGNFSKMMTDVRESTAGMVSDQGLKKSIALMTSFGIPTQGMADSLGLVQKMAIRTGQSADFLTESFARGISRLSPLILDNLGIQVSLADANSAYAKSIGKTTDELTKAEQTTALLNETLRLLKKNTQGIDLEASAGGTIARAGVLWDNAIDKIKEFGAEGIVGLDLFFGGLETKVKFQTGLMRLNAAQTKDAAGNLSIFGKATEASANALDALAKHSELLESFSLGKVFASSEDFNRVVDFTQSLSDRLENYRESLALARAGHEDYLELIGQDVGSLLIENVEGAKTAAADMVAQFKAVVAARGESLTKAEEERLIAEAQDRAQKRILETMVWIKRLTGDNTQAQAEALLNLLASGDAYKGITDELLKQSESWVKNTRAEREAMEAMDARLKGHKDELTFMSRRNAMLDGQILSEIELGEVKANLAAAEEKVNEALVRYKEAQSASDKKAILAELDGLRQKATAANQRYRAAYAFNADQMTYIDKFKNATKAVVDAEVIKLKTQAGQLRLQASQLEIMLRILAAGKEINTEQIMAFRLQADSAEALAKRLGSGKTTGGGGAGPRAPAEREAPWSIGLDEPRNLEFFEKAQAASLEFRNMLGEMKTAGISAGSTFMGLDSLLGADTKDLGEVKATLAQLREIQLQHEYMNEMARKQGQPMAAALSEDDLAVLQQAEAMYAQMAAHMERMAAVGDALTSVTDVMQTFADGMQDIFGDDVISMVNDLQRGLEGMAEAFKENASGYDMMLAGMPIIRAFTANLIKDLKTRAWFEMAMQAGAAWAAFASGNIPKGVMHVAAAGAYGLVAGGVIKLPKGKAKDDSTGRSERQTAARRDVHIHIAGPIATTEAERGAMIRDAIRAAEREGI